MSRMDEFREMMPDQAAIAKYYAGDTVAEWDDGLLRFTVTWDGGQWEVIISGHLEDATIFIDASRDSVTSAMNHALSRLAWVLGEIAKTTGDGREVWSILHGDGGET